MQIKRYPLIDAAVRYAIQEANVQHFANQRYEEWKARQVTNDISVRENTITER